MSALFAYVEKHTRVHAPQRAMPVDGAVNMVFFQVECVGKPQAEQLLALVRAHRGEFATLDVLDGIEHSYIDLGAWIGDQGVALRFMALGTALGVFELFTPKAILGQACDDETEARMAGMGYITVRRRPPTEGGAA